MEKTFRPTSPGVEICVVRRHAGAGMSFVVRMANGGLAPHHDHPLGEENYLISGKIVIGRRSNGPDVVLGPGDYHYAPPGELHEVVAHADDTVVFVVAPGGVVRTHA